jgi:hypothetical protein
VKFEDVRDLEDVEMSKNPHDVKNDQLKHKVIGNQNET